MTDENIYQKIGKFRDQPPRSSLCSKIVRFSRDFLKKKRLPVRGWLTSILRDSKGKGGWWNNPFVVMKVNELVCGKQVEGRDQGLICCLKDRYSERIPLPKGVSVGCGNGSKEIVLLQSGIVEHFDLFELSKKKIDDGVKLAKSSGVSDRVNFFCGNAFEIVNKNSLYDIVVWCDSLHHMPDVDYALRWSRKILRNGGIFYLSDYVGPNRLQWNEKIINMARDIRKNLDQKFIVECDKPFHYPPAEICPPNIEELVAKDPSEAWDSVRIIPSIEKYFPEIEVFPVGGVVYFAALNGCIHNFDSKKDRDILGLLMLIDRMYMEKGETLYAAALGCKAE